MALVTVIVPVFNEEANVLKAYDAILAVFAGLGEGFDVEILFSDNHSTDSTFELLTQLAKKDRRVKVLRYNRNYGFQSSLLTAYRHASGDVAVQLDCDLQDPPGLIAEFVRLWQQGHDVVVGLRRRRQENPLLTWMRRSFYKFLDRISEDKITPDAGDFRLVDRSILYLLRQIDDQTPYVRGLVSSLAVNEAAVPYDRDRRLHGESKFPVRKLFGFALNGIFGHSMSPLRLAVYIGAGVSVGTFILSGFYLVGALLFGKDWPSGFATTSLLILFGISLNGIFMGVMGEYISRIYKQVRQRPLTIIERSLNLSQQGEETRESGNIGRWSWVEDRRRIGNAPQAYDHDRG